LKCVGSVNNLDMRRLVAIVSSCALLLAPAAAEAAKKPPPRKGGTVHRAWPAKGHTFKPHSYMARFLARQVGPVKITKRMRRAARRPHASIAADTAPSTTKDASSTQKLYLVRSYDIPSDDPSAARLANLSWTYDSAISAVALDADKDPAQAQQLLDQLAALQRTDGSLDFAYDTSTGASVQQFRAGTIAWVGYAAALHRQATGATRYNALTAGAAKWLLTQQQASGLLRGGPDVTWASTQNNLLAYLFLNLLAISPPSGLTSTQLTTAASKIAGGLESLLVTPASGQLAFAQGTNDALRPLDAQTLGIIYLLARGRYADALKVHNYVESAFKLSSRTITKSTAVATFNNSYSASGPFSGYRPYATGGPDVIWHEGSAQADFTTGLLGLDNSAQDKAIAAWAAVTTSRKQGPLQSDRTVTDSTINEYHVWPASAGTSWSLIAANGLPG
jgi:hypothetical protein